MNNDELLLTARGELASMLLNPNSKIRRKPEEFTEVKILEAPTAIVRFYCKDRSDPIELYPNSETSSGVARIMSQDELLTNARRHVNEMVAEPEKYTEAKILETPAVTVRFKSNDAEETIELILNAETGGYIFGSHTSKQPPPSNPD